MTSFYRAEKVTSKVTAIRSLTGEIMYLIEGEEKAVLVDTCLGVGNLRAFVESLTTKLITVILTHGHVDHALGAPEFEDVYFNSKDEKIYEKMSPLEERQGYIRGNLGGELPELDYVQPASLKYKELKDGDVFSLGGVCVEAYALAGHTPGTMVVLVREEGILILGDACNTATFLFDEDALPVETYQKNLQALKLRLEGQYDRVLLCHHDMETDVHILENVIALCSDIMEGNTDDMPFEFMGHTSYIAKNIKEGFVRVDGISGNIIYNKEKIRE